ncbi:OPT oligopeptide transporter protein-domain-containing protein [Russula compacta]|nr:OPT oligopeptide transporter protein-domain-containing protein [Russula compacta]
MTELQGTLPVLAPSPTELPSEEKKAESEYVDTPGKEEASSDSDKTSYGNEDVDESPFYVNGEPVITTGKDVSKYLVDLRDDEDPPVTLRSVLLGTVVGGLGAAVYQIYIFKPASDGISTVFLILIIYSFGVFWSTFLPKRSLVEGTRYKWAGPALHFINPGKFRLKEHVVSTIVASTASYGSTSVMNFSVQRLYYDTNVHATTAILATFSTAVFGYGIVGLLRPLTVYPSEMVYWLVRAMPSLIDRLHFDTASNHKRIRVFWAAFAVMFIYEIIPSYIFPLLNGFNIFCLASQHAPPGVQDVFTNIFGGADSNEGLGLFSLSFDWQYIGSRLQVNSWVGLFFSYIAIAAIYYSNIWNVTSKSFPMLSTSLFSSNGSIYNQRAVFTGPNFQLNETALDEIGLPALTGSNAWLGLMSLLSIGGLIAHCILFWGPYVLASFKHSREKTQPDPHWIAMQKYEEAPWWWYLILLTLAFFAGLISVLRGETTLPVWSYIVALISDFQMIAGAINPGRPVANLYFSMWSHDIPPRVMFLTQIWGTIVVVMIAITGSQRELLLEPNGNNIWSGLNVQLLNSNAVTWSLAQQLYDPSGPYFVIPMGIFIGFGATCVHWLVHKRWPYIGPIKVENVLLPIIYMYAYSLAGGVNSIVTSMILVGLTSQFWMRRYHPGWYRKYNYLLGGAFDGGAQFMIFILSFAVFGASGIPRPFPGWAGNPAKGNVDYCNGNGALDPGGA